MYPQLLVVLKVVSTLRKGLEHWEELMTLGYATLVGVKLVMLTLGNWESQMAVERVPALLTA
jgi:hypothetical protein